MVRLYESRMDPVHVVATLTRLQHLLRWRPPRPESASSSPSDGAASLSHEQSPPVSTSNPSSSFAETAADAWEMERLATATEITRLLVPVIQAISATRRSVALVGGIIAA